MMMTFSFCSEHHCSSNTMAKFSYVLKRLLWPSPTEYVFRHLWSHIWFCNSFLYWQCMNIVFCMVTILILERVNEFIWGQLYSYTSHLCPRALKSGLLWSPFVSRYLFGPSILLLLAVHWKEHPFRCWWISIYARRYFIEALEAYITKEHLSPS